MSSRHLFVVGIILLGLCAGTTVLADDTGSAPKAEKASGDSNRGPAATDQVFSPAYLQQVNAAQQAADEQKRQDEERHDKLIDRWMRGF